MRFNLNLEGDTSELPELLEALTNRGLTYSSDAPVGGDTAETVAAPKARKERTAKSADASPAAPTETKATAAVDPFAASATQAFGDLAAAAQSTTVATPASGQTATATASPSDGSVTYDMLKDKMTEVLKAKSAAAAQQIVKDASGGKPSLSQCTPDQYPAVYAALTAALA